MPADNRLLSGNSVNKMSSFTQVTPTERRNPNLVSHPIIAGGTLSATSTDRGGTITATGGTDVDITYQYKYRVGGLSANPSVSLTPRNAAAGGDLAGNAFISASSGTGFTIGGTITGGSIFEYAVVDRYN